MAESTKYDLNKTIVRHALASSKWVINDAAQALGMPRTTLSDAIARMGLIDEVKRKRRQALTVKPISKSREELDAEFWRGRFRSAEKDVNYLKRLRTEAFKLQDATIEFPEWAITPHKRSADIPVLFTSDFQWGEVIDIDEMDGMNKFNLPIARQRYRQLIGSTIDICKNYRQQTKYPGIVYLRGGDSINGDIHDELQRTNEAPSTMQVMDLFAEETRGIELLRQAFGKVIVISVPGNHGRLTKKPIAKKYAEWNFDFMLSLMLEQQCASKDVTFMSPSSGEAYFQLYGIRFLLTHGDRIGSRGGQGFIGPIATMIRGVKKTRDAYATMNKLIDWVLLGHFHTSAMGPGFIANGSLPGYGEYAKALKAVPEAPRQTLFFVNRKYGLNEYRSIILSDQSTAHAEWFESAA